MQRGVILITTSGFIGYYFNDTVLSVFYLDTDLKLTTLAWCYMVKAKTFLEVLMNEIKW